jgi:hypothetical protein
MYFRQVMASPVGASLKMSVAVGGIATQIV